MDTVAQTAAGQDTMKDKTLVKLGRRSSVITIRQRRNDNPDQINHDNIIIFISHNAKKKAISQPRTLSS